MTSWLHMTASDPAAQWTGALRSAAFFAYANNYLIDVKFGIIMDVEVLACHPAGRSRRIADDDRTDRSLLWHQANGSQRTPRDVARALAKTEAFARSRCDRKKVEMLFAHLKRILRLGRLRLRGPSGAQFEFTLAAIAQNLRRLAKLVVRPPPITSIECVV